MMIIKSNADDPNNYRGITLLSCVGKLFTGILNVRLNVFCEVFNILSENQAGFRKRHSTIDHSFVLKSLCDIMKFQKKKLFVAFIDYVKAFDKIWRQGLWYKLKQYNIKGKILAVIQSMYSSIKSCIIGAGGATSDFFESHIVLRQGENLSPILFGMFENDLEQYLIQEGNSGIELGNYTGIDMYLKLFVLLYADDTILLSSSAAGLSKALSGLESYCVLLKLKVNSQKTKIVIFGIRHKHNNYSFSFNNSDLEIVSTFKYLGIIFNVNGNFSLAKQQQKTQAERAMFCLLNKCKKLKLPIDIQLELFDKIVVPILLYGSEIWGFENVKVLESLHLKFCKYILNVKKSTPNCMVYGELGRFSLDLNIKCRVIAFWANLVFFKNDKISRNMYTLLRQMHDKNVYTSKWMSYVKSILDTCGLSNIWSQYENVNVKWLKLKVKQTLQDHFIQEWHESMQTNRKAINYRLFKTEFKFENYLVKVPDRLRITLCNFRVGSSKLPVERGRYQNIERERRYCNICNCNKLGDEFHLLLECNGQNMNDLRKKYLPKFCQSGANVVKFESLLNSQSVVKLTQLAKFLVECNKLLT